MARFDTLELERFPRRALVMAAVALAAVAIDFVSKHIMVSLEPDTLLFHVSDRDPFGVGAALIVVVATTSLLASVVPARAVVLGAGAALGGAVGNLVSREWWSARGGSPDFIRFSDGSTGNVADLFIASGIAAMLIGIALWLALTAIRHRRLT